MQNYTIAQISTINMELKGEGNILKYDNNFPVKLQTLFQITGFIKSLVRVNLIIF